MRNFYSRLGVKSSASKEEIRAAINAHPNATMRENASEVLLVAEHRREYDRLNSLLTTIGYLRSGLGINYADNWRGDIADEYSGSSLYTTSQHEIFVRKVKAMNESQFTRSARPVASSESDTRYTRPASSESEHGFGRFLVIGIIVIIGWNVFFDENKQKTNRSVSNSTQYGGVDVNSAKKNLPVNGSTSGQSGRQSNSSIESGAERKNVGQAKKNIQPVFNEPPLPLPYSGTTRKSSAYGAVQEIMPVLEIRTQGTSHYLVKLEDLQGRDIMDVFVRGGSSAEVEVPVGKYIIKYVSGSVWYGYRYRFGPEPRSSYNKADHIFSFTVTQNGNYYTWSKNTIQLYQSIDGNMTTSDISEDEF